MSKFYVTKYDYTFEQLKSLADHTSLAFVLDTLADMCNAKAEHLEENWQDYESAKLWEKHARMLSSQARKARELQ